MNPNNSPLIYGRLPPQNTELEAAVLGAILLESECLIAVSEIITTPEVFYKHEHQLIYTAIQATVKAGSRVDTLTVIDQMRKLGTLEDAGGNYALTMLTMNVVSSAHVGDHAGKIHHYWQRREIIRIAGEAMEAAYEPDAEASTVAEAVLRDLSSVMDSGDADTTVHVGVVADECMETAERAMQNPGILTGVDTGIRELNRVTNGWQRPNLIILAARPSQGKTALALILALNADKPILIFSLEMSRQEITNRMLASVSGVPLEAINHGTMSPDQYNQVNAARHHLRSRKILIDDKAGLTTANFQARVRKWKRRYNIGLVIVDYLQLMLVLDKRTKLREAQVAEISRELKLAAKEAGIPVIALSQMNRNVEQTKRKPMLSDLRESGAIEQDADMVMFIWHEDDANTGKTKNWVVIAKNRNGKVEDVQLKFVGATQRWTDVDVFEGEPFNPYAGMQSHAARWVDEEQF